MLGNLLISWTIRVSLACYVCVLIGWSVPKFRPIVRRYGRWVWLTGMIVFVIHVICAFGFRHHWSHAHAYQHTADVTAEFLGWRFGEGIYFSYLFTVVWLIDAIWWCVRPPEYLRRARGLTLAVHGYMFFIAFNGAIVFEDGPTRWAGLIACLALGGLLLPNFFGKKITANRVHRHGSQSNEPAETIEHPA